MISGKSINQFWPQHEQEKWGSKIGLTESHVKITIDKWWINEIKTGVSLLSENEKKKKKKKKKMMMMMMMMMMMIMIMIMIMMKQWSKIESLSRLSNKRGRWSWLVVNSKHVLITMAINIKKRHEYCSKRWYSKEEEHNGKDGDDDYNDKQKSYKKAFLLKNLKIIIDRHLLPTLCYQAR